MKKPVTVSEESDERNRDSTRQKLSDNFRELESFTVQDLQFIRKIL